MGQAFDVSANIGFDGSTYFCKRCGKAGYGRATQVRGHLAMCPGTLMRKGVVSTTSSNQLQPLASGYGGGLSGSQLLQPLAVVGPIDNPVDNSVDVKYEELVGRVAVMENHANHLMQLINQPQYQPATQDFFSQYKGVIIMAAIILFAILLSKESGQCEAGSSDKSVGMGALGVKALSKVVDIGISKGITSLFK